MRMRSWWLRLGLTLGGSALNVPVLVFCLVGTLALGCSSEEVEVKPELDPIRVKLGFIGQGTPSAWRLAPRDMLLDIPTATPFPTPTPYPTFVPFESLGPVGVGVSRLPPLEVSLSCLDEFRADLAGYDGRGLFGAEVAQALSVDLVARRPECSDGGWSPRFGLAVVCEGGEVAGVKLPNGLVRLEGNFHFIFALGSGRDDDGNILLHFEKLPYADGPGCWFYRALDRQWAWQGPGPEKGVDRRELRACDVELRERLLLPGRDVDPYNVVMLRDQISSEYPLDCPAVVWDSFPQLEGYELCGRGYKTGRWGDGKVVVNWRSGNLGGGSSLCWVWSTGEGLWKVYYENGGVKLFAPGGELVDLVLEEVEVEPFVEPTLEAELGEASVSMITDGPGGSGSGVYEVSEYVSDEKVGGVPEENREFDDVLVEKEGVGGESLERCPDGILWMESSGLLRGPAGEVVHNFVNENGMLRDMNGVSLGFWVDSGGLLRGPLGEEVGLCSMVLGVP